MLAFLPELILCGTIVLLLLLRLVTRLQRVHLGMLALLLTVAASRCDYLPMAVPVGNLAQPGQVLRNDQVVEYLHRPACL